MNRIYAEDVLHLGKEIAARYGISTSAFGGKSKAERAMRSPSGRVLAANAEEFTLRCIRAGWINYTEAISGVPMSDLEYSIDWDKIDRDQRRAAAARDEMDPAGCNVARPVYAVDIDKHNRRVVLHRRKRK